MFHIPSQRGRTDGPPLLRRIAIEQCMHGIGLFVGELVGFQDPVGVYDLDEDTAFGTVRGIVEEEFNAVDVGLSGPRVLDAVTEDG